MTYIHWMIIIFHITNEFNCSGILGAFIKIAFSLLVLNAKCFINNINMQDYRRTDLLLRVLASAAEWSCTLTDSPHWRKLINYEDTFCSDTYGPWGWFINNVLYRYVCVYVVCEPVDKRITDFHALKTQTL